MSNSALVAQEVAYESAQEVPVVQEMKRSLVKFMVMLVSLQSDID
jgi:hypothetical protein